MSVDNLSISFASSMGIENIKDEFLKDDINLYTDLDDLEKSVEAEFEQYMNQARSFPFHNQPAQHPEQSTDVHSDYDQVSGTDLLDQVENESMHGRLLHYSQEVDEEEYNDEIPLSKDDNSIHYEQESERAESLGAYFGARSLPLESVDDDEEDVWRQTQSYEPSHEENGASIQQSFSVVAESTSKYKTSLEARFKSLPENIRLFPKYELPDIKLHHPYTQRRNRSSASSMSSTRQQYSSRNRQNRSPSQASSRKSRTLDHSLHDDSFEEEEKEFPCIIEPTSPLRFLCEISEKTIYAKVVHLKITNSSPNVVRSFSLFSQNNLLEFQMSEGMILEHEMMDIKIKIRSSALSSYQRQYKKEGDLQPLEDKLLVLIDKKYAHELDVCIDFISLEEEEEENSIEQVEMSPKRPKCKYCALEKGYSLHCL